MRTMQKHPFVFLCRGGHTGTGTGTAHGRHVSFQVLTPGVTIGKEFAIQVFHIQLNADAGIFGRRIGYLEHFLPFHPGYHRYLSQGPG